MTLLLTARKLRSSKTVRTCEPVAVDGFPGISKLANPEGRQLLAVEPALWLFVTVEGIEPTNNAAEQAIRPAVLWRKCSYGSQSAQGSLFVGRIMTVVTSLRRQHRHVLDYLSAACRAQRQGLPAPSLLPISTPANSSLVP